MKWTINQFSASLIRTLKQPRINRRVLIGVVILATTVGGLAAWTIKRRANREYDLARSALERTMLVPFEKDLRRALDPSAVTIIQSHNIVRDVERFNGSYFVASDGGLAQLAEEGRLKRVYTVLDGLPESDL